MALRGHAFLFVTWNGGGNVPPPWPSPQSSPPAATVFRVVGPRSLTDAVHTAGCSFVPFSRAPERTRSPGALKGKCGHSAGGAIAYAGTPSVSGEALEVQVVVDELEDRLLPGDGDREAGERQPVARRMRPARRKLAHRGQHGALDGEQ